MRIVIFYLNLEMTFGLNSYEYNSIKSALGGDRSIRKSYPYKDPVNEFC